MHKINRLVTVHGVIVDSVASAIWNANERGTKDITAEQYGVRINWNFGSTFVPWSNVRYTLEDTVIDYINRPEQAVR